MKPKATLLMVTYNHEKFIAEALESALAQTYENLEILISDDCSTDNTYGIILKKISEYSGPHKVKVRQTEKNIGGIENFNSSIKFVEGDYISLFHGDDICAPSRVSRVMEAWEQTKCPVISSNFNGIDEDGNFLYIGREEGKLFDTGIREFASCGINICCYGAALNFSRELFEKFGPVQRDWSPYNCDHIIPTWGLISGGNLYIPDVLVSHRHHAASDSRKVLNTTDKNNYDESKYAHYLTQAIYSLHAFTHARSNGCNVDGLNEAISMLGNFIISRSAAWMRCRNSLIVNGYTYQWTKDHL